MPEPPKTVPDGDEIESDQTRGDRHGEQFNKWFSDEFDRLFFEHFSNGARTQKCQSYQK